MKLRITAKADADLQSIWEYFATENPAAANRLEDALHNAMQFLAEFPGLGHCRADVREKRYRFWSVFSYLIAYRTEGEDLIVVRVLHGARDIRRSLGTWP